MKHKFIRKLTHGEREIHMYKLLIVEDETRILEGLCNYAWESFNIKCIGSCAHGMEALKFIEEDIPDIILTDIHMPIMSGLELVERLQQQYPSIISVILTGYAEFEYARKSIKSGVRDYLLKPIDYDELKTTFINIINILDERHRTDSNLQLAEQKKKLLTSAIRKKFLKELFFTPMSEDEIAENAILSEMTLNNGTNLTVAIISLDRLNKSEISYSKKDLDLILYAFDNILKEYFENNNIGYYWVESKSCNIYFLFELDEGMSVLKQYIEEIKQNLYKIRGIFKSKISVSLGSSKETATDIFQSAKEARSVFSCISHDNDFALYDSSFQPSNEDHESTSSGSTSVDINISPQSGLHIINSAVRYINENFTKVITLEDVAAVVYTNSVYLSYLFKQATGIKFTHYLTNLRIQKAKELLKDPKYKVQDVSEAVGYENYRYFSQIFKRYVGKTPFEYRSHV